MRYGVALFLLLLALGTSVPAEATHRRWHKRTPTPTVSPTPPPAGQTWTETWANGTGAWTYNGVSPSCPTEPGLLHLRRDCAQNLLSRQTWRHTAPLSVQGRVRGQPVGTTPYFCGLALYQDAQVYAQLAVGRGILPASRVGSLTVNTVWWYDETGGTYVWPTSGISVDAWQDFTVRWNGVDTWNAVLNGGGLQSYRVSDVRAPLRIDVQGVPLYFDNSECQFGPVTVVGTPV